MIRCVICKTIAGDRYVPEFHQNRWICHDCLDYTPEWSVIESMLGKDITGMSPGFSSWHAEYLLRMGIHFDINRQDHEQ